MAATTSLDNPFTDNISLNNSLSFNAFDIYKAENGEVVQPTATDEYYHPPQTSTPTKHRVQKRQRQPSLLVAIEQPGNLTEFQPVQITSPRDENSKPTFVTGGNIIDTTDSLSPSSSMSINLSTQQDPTIINNPFLQYNVITTDSYRSAPTTPRGLNTSARGQQASGYNAPLGSQSNPFDVGYFDTLAPVDGGRERAHSISVNLGQAPLIDQFGHLVLTNELVGNTGSTGNNTNLNTSGEVKAPRASTRESRSKEGKTRSKEKEKRAKSSRSTGDKESKTKTQSKATKADLRAKNGILKLDVIEAKNLNGLSLHRVKVFIKNKEDEGMAFTTSAETAEPKWGCRFQLYFEDKEVERCALRIEEDTGTHVGSVAFNIQSMKPDERKVLWTRVPNTNVQIKIRAKWVPNSRLQPTGDPLDKNSRVRLIPHLVVKINSDLTFAGSKLEGKVVFNSQLPTKFFKAVTIRFQGEEYVNGTSGKEINSTKIVSAQRTIVNTVKVLEKISKKSKSIGGPNGKKSWPFSIDIPEKIPPNYSSEYGFTRYVLVAAIDDGSKNVFSLPIKVVTPFNHHGGPAAKDKCFRESRAHHIKLEARVNRWIVALGDKIRLSLRIVNHSSHVLGKVKISVKEQILIYDDQSKHPHVAERILAKRSLHNVCNPDTTFEKDYNITLPRKYNQQTITTQQGGKYIRVHHFIELKGTKLALVHQHKQSVTIPLAFVHPTTLKNNKTHERIEKEVAL